MAPGIGLLLDNFLFSLFYRIMDPLASHSLMKRSALSDRVYDHLKTRIIDLDLEPGARLHAETLAAELDVSPTPVREALNRLAAEGIVTAAPYRGFRVSPLLSRGELVQLLQTRQVIEGAAVRQAATSRTEGGLRELVALVTRMDELSASEPLDVKAFNAADAAFHRLTVSSSGNRFFLQAFDALHTHVQIARHYQGRSVVEARIANAEHRELLTALSAQDAESAGEQARRHIDGVLARLQAHLAAHDGGLRGEDGEMP